jgi:hypothetical protein
MGRSYPLTNAKDKADDGGLCLSTGAVYKIPAQRDTRWRTSIRAARERLSGSARVHRSERMRGSLQTCFTALLPLADVSARGWYARCTGSCRTPQGDPISSHAFKFWMLALLAACSAELGGANEDGSPSLEDLQADLQQRKPAAPVNHSIPTLNQPELQH